MPYGTLLPSFLLRALLVAGALACPFLGSAQPAPAAWQSAASGGSPDPDGGNSLAVDAGGNTYVTGACASGARFGTVTLPGEGGTDVFVAKYNSRGVLLWVRSGGSQQDDGGIGLAVDAAGNCYVSGTIGGDATFGTRMVAGSLGQDDAFVLSYDPAGTVRWVYASAGIGMKTSGKLALDGGGNVYAVGGFSGEAVFGSTTLTSTGTGGGPNEPPDGFVVSYAPTGAMRWARQIANPDGITVSAIGVSAVGDYYITGGFGVTATIGSTTLTAVGEVDGFVAKFNASGLAQWANSFGGIDGHIIPAGMAVSPTGECYVVGDSDVPSLDFGPFQQPNPSAIQGFMGYVVRYSKGGNPRWARGVGSTENAGTYAVDVRGAALHLTGAFAATATFESPTGAVDVLATTLADLFVARYDTAGGQLTAVTTASGNQPDQEVAVGQGIAIDALGNTHITGLFGTFDGSPGTLQLGTLPTLPAYGDVDMYVATLSPGPLATPNALAEAAFRIFPNPVAPAARLTVAGLAAGTPLHLTLLDALGRVVQTKMVVPANGAASWAPAALPAGLYTLRAEQAGAPGRTRRVVVVE
ncbi:MAG: hypothetical protein H7330_13190 [Hymenobacteraceae bacterium]|nr:hypothetical protein [Hymenobacteraceae bacterium]